MIENQSSIADWAEITFGRSSPMRCCTRMNEEVAELLKWLSFDVHQTSESLSQKIDEECADILIVLYVLADRLEIDIHKEVDKKMVINRARKWKLDGSGCGQHIEEASNG